ncbi:branched-chain amino acid ABC transporter permease [Ramlibacter ginsenosidimutans]|uniref:Branched-chain amino acid ABC transporter permease n=1 Tax=Ramlibacter ginsenosidimutans TaxID=502333 RepID=A0A934TV96_9BURK|nr:branched-chain amino acid ABC transporter permease [Ramlibacter ginsenosidimutans]MBK6007950.1 branched-chain amino acid ABC transporter permease [Ramlibacter ginsenosidimutans]
MLLQITASGLAMGAIYALIALGYAFVWNTMAIVNFAAGEFVTFAAYIFVATFITQLGFPFWLALASAAAVMALLGAIFSRVVFARLQKQRPLVAIIATVAFGIFLKEMARILYGPEPLIYTGPFGSGSGIHVGNIVIGWQNLLILAVVVVLTIAQGIVLKRTMLGKMMRAVALDRDTAALMGIPVQRVLAGTFAWSSVLAALAGMLLAPLFFVTTEMGSMVGLKGFVAMIIGGFGSIPGAIIGGLLLGVGENWASYLLSSTYRDVIAFVILLLFLAVRPQGLLPERTADRA